MQKEILDQHPTAPLSVYVVWFSMLATDSRSRWGWTSGAISDNRAIHFWDEHRLVGSWLAKQENPNAESPGIVWDAFYLYAPDQSWNESAPLAIASGATVQGEADKLKEQIQPLLRQK